MDKNKFLDQYKITQKDFEAADLSWETLEKIYNDYEQRKKKYEKLARKLSDSTKSRDEEKELLIFHNPKKIGLHSVYWRVKDSEHLIAKIIRKRNENYKKYKNINETNYWMIVRDLLGFRGLLVFREEWPKVHAYITSYYKNNSKLYIDDNDLGTYNKGVDCYLAEPTKAHIRDGDAKDMYKSYLGEENIIPKQTHRSVHYILKYHDICIELQIRTLFEEALGEMDHIVRYPVNMRDQRLTNFAGIMNHLVGVVDELGSFYLDTSGIRQDSQLMDKQKEDPKEDVEKFVTMHEDIEPINMETPQICLENIIKN